MIDSSDFSSCSDAGFVGLFQNAPMGIILLSESGQIARVNPYAEKLFGYSAQELIGSPVERLIPESLRERNSRYRSILFGNSACRLRQENIQHEVLHKDGTIFPVEVTVMCLKKGDVTEMAAFVSKSDNQFREQDLSLIREQSIRLFIEHTPSAVAVFDLQMRYLMVSRRWTEDYQLGDKNIIGFSHYDIFPDIPQRWRDFHNRGLAGETLHCDEDSFQRLDGRTEWVSWELCPWYTYSGIIGGIVLFSEVITARKEAEDALRKLNEELEQKVLERTSLLADALDKANESNEMKSAFVSMASHEFRTPLSAILSSATIAEKYTEGSQQEKREKHFLRIKSSVMHLVDILDDFLSLEKLEQGKIKAEKLIFNLDELMQNIIDEFSGILKKEQAIAYSYQGEKDVLLDKKILRNVMHNLLSNAVKYSDTVIVLKVEVNNQQVSIQVIDKGIGIPAADQKNIFSKFYRARNAAYIQGTGLGLNMVKSYVGLMGGTIEFSSREGQGTVFSLILHSYHGGRQLLIEEALV